MKRITIILPEDLAAELERESHRERVSVSEIARKAIEARLRPLPIVDGKRKIPFIGIGRSDRTDLSERVGRDLILTLDRRHFGALRMSDGRPFTILPD